MKIEALRIKREDGTILAVVDTYVSNDGNRFMQLRVVEDSDWLHVDDMQLLAIQLNSIAMKLQYQDSNS